MAKTNKKKTAASPLHERDLWLVHRLNGQLLETMFKSDSCVFKRCSKSWAIEDWIINILYLVRSPLFDFGSRVTLKTSAILHRGELYNDMRLPGSKVARLDEEVPIEGSVSGHCAKIQHPVWLDQLQLLPNSKTIGKKLYRPFNLVNVAANAVPKSEVVFPITLQCGFSNVVLGVMNLEFFPQSTGNRVFEDLRLMQEDLNHAVYEVVCLHAPFLKLALDLAENRIAMESDGDSSLLSMHRSVMELAANSNTSIDLQTELRKTTSGIARNEE